MGLYCDLYVGEITKTANEECNTVLHLNKHTTMQIKRKTHLDFDAYSHSLSECLGIQCDCYIPDTHMPAIMKLVGVTEFDHPVDVVFSVYWDTYDCWDGEVTFCAKVVPSSNLLLQWRDN